MCTFILLGIEKGRSSDAAHEVLKNCEHLALRVDNAHLHEQVPTVEFFVNSRSGCDCNSLIGKGNTKAGLFEDELLKLRRKKWSQTRIDKWIAQKRAHNEARALGFADKAKDEWLHWQSLIKAVLDARVGSVCLMYHLFSGNVSTEEIRVKASVSVAVDAFDESGFVAMKEDVVYRFGKTTNGQ